MNSVQLYLVFHLIGSLLAAGYLWQALFPQRKEILNRIAASIILALFLSWIIVGMGFYNVANERRYIYPKQRRKPKTKQE